MHYKKATGISPHTILEYQTTFKKLHGLFADYSPLASLSREELVTFFAWLQDGYLSEPAGVAPRGKIKLAPKNIANIHTNLSSFWSWGAQEGFVPANVIRTIAPAPFTPPAIEPLTKEDVAILLKACDCSRTWKTRPDVANRRPSADRDRAIILTLLDTCVRASELCGIRFGDLSLGQKSLKVSGKGPGTEGKERIVFFGKRTGQAIWRCLAGRLDSMRPEDPVFTVGSAADPRPLTAPVLRKLLDRIGDKASVPNVYPIGSGTHSPSPTSATKETSSPYNPFLDIPIWLWSGATQGLPYVPIGLTRYNWVNVLDAKSIPSGEILSLEAALTSDQVKHRGVLADVNQPGIGVIEILIMTTKFSRTPARIEMPPPRLSEHTETILSELGHSADELKALKEKMVI